MNISWKNCFKVGISIFILYLCIIYLVPMFGFVKMMADAAKPLFIGCIIAYIVNIIMSFYERHYFPKSKNIIIIKSRRPICVLLAYCTVVIVVLLVVALVLPQLLSCIEVIIDLAKPLIAKFIIWINRVDGSWLPKGVEDFFLNFNWDEFVEKLDWEAQINRAVEILSAATIGVGSVVDSLIDFIITLMSGVVTAVVSLVFSVYLLFAKDKLKIQFTKLFDRYLPEKANKKTKYVLEVFDNSFHRYFVAQCAEAVILGVLCTLGMTVFGMPYAPMIGALVAITALIPIVGAFIGAGIGAFMILTVSPFKALMFIIFIIILQQIEENLIYPRVVGSSVNLPGIWVLAAITVGGGVFGIFGMLIAVPIAAAVYSLLKNDVNNGKKKSSKNTSL